MEGLNNHAINFSFSECVGRQKGKFAEDYAPHKKTQDRVNLWEKKVSDFYLYNPEYAAGVVQVGVPALKTEGCMYQISIGRYLDDALVTKTAEKGLNWVKATLEEKRNGMTMGKKYVRMHYARTYYVEKFSDGTAKAKLLLDNDDWLVSENVDKAFGFILGKQFGKFLENLDWRTIQYKGYQNIARVVRYQDRQGNNKILICTASSGAILTMAEDEIKIGEKCPAAGRNFGSPVLRYQRTDVGLMRLKNL